MKPHFALPGLACVGAAIALFAGALAPRPAAAQPAGPPAATHPAITFLEGKAAADALLDDKAQPYFALLGPLEMAAKTGKPLTGKTPEEQRAEFRQRYRDAVAEFTPLDRKLLDQAAALVARSAADYPLYASLPWSFIKVTAAVEGGLPHTRGDSIVLPQGVLRVLSLAYLRTPEAAVRETATLLAHEQVHVLQRRHPKLFQGLYREVWGMQYAAKIASRESLESRAVVNPDATDLNWVLPVRAGAGVEYHWPRILFRAGRAVPRMPGDFELLAVPVEKTAEGFAVKVGADGKAASRRLHEVEAFARTFLDAPAPYHPAEATADLFARLLRFDHMGGGAGLPEERRQEILRQLAPLREWCGKNLKAP